MLKAKIDAARAKLRGQQAKIVELRQAAEAKLREQRAEIVGLRRAIADNTRMLRGLLPKRLDDRARTVMLAPETVNAFIANEDVICVFCSDGVNIDIDESSGKVLRALCASCRTRIHNKQANRCRGGAPNCMGTRYVDELGKLSPLCKFCHKQRVAERAAETEDRSAETSEEDEATVGKASKPRGRISAATPYSRLSLWSQR